MLVDLVQTTTHDGVRLDGALQSPAGPHPPTGPVDAFCLLHGTGGNFYGSSLFESLAERFLALGCAVLRGNTRGHDGISTAQTAAGGRRQGAAYEIVDDCRQDVAAWIDWLRQRGQRRIGLVGHSLGAVKSIYALAREPRLEVACLVALSPPRLSYSWYRASPQGPEFLEIFATAERHFHAGQAAALLDVKIPIPYVVTAAGYVEKYGPDERYNLLKFVADVPCPTLITLGSIETETNMAFRELPEALAGLAQRHGQLRVETISGADHFYSGVRQELATCVEAWLGSLPS